jgi:hypothetical protein
MVASSSSSSSSARAAASRAPTLRRAALLWSCRKSGEVVGPRRAPSACCRLSSVVWCRCPRADGSLVLPCPATNQAACGHFIVYRIGEDARVEALGRDGPGRGQRCEVGGAVPGATLCRPREALLLVRYYLDVVDDSRRSRTLVAVLPLQLSLALTHTLSLYTICTQDVRCRRCYSCTAADIGRPCSMTTTGAGYPAQLPHLDTLTTTSHVASLQHRIAHVQLREGCISLRISPFHFCFFTSRVHGVCPFRLYIIPRLWRVPSCMPSPSLVP